MALRSAGMVAIVWRMASRRRRTERRVAHLVVLLGLGHGRNLLFFLCCTINNILLHRQLFAKHAAYGVHGDVLRPCVYHLS